MPKYWNDEEVESAPEPAPDPMPEPPYHGEFIPTHLKEKREVDRSKCVALVMDGRCPECGYVRHAKNLEPHPAV